MLRLERPNSGFIPVLPSEMKDWPTIRLNSKFELDLTSGTSPLVALKYIWENRQNVSKKTEFSRCIQNKNIWHFFPNHATESSKSKIVFLFICMPFWRNWVIYFILLLSNYEVKFWINWNSYQDNFILINIFCLFYYDNFDSNLANWLGMKIDINKVENRYWKWKCF